jgi:hypothetical protein
MTFSSFKRQEIVFKIRQHEPDPARYADADNIFWQIGFLKLQSIATGSIDLIHSPKLVLSILRCEDSFYTETGYGVRLSRVWTHEIARIQIFLVPHVRSKPSFNYLLIFYLLSFE